MSEGIRAKDLVTRPRVVFAALLASVAFAGCGGVSKSADTNPLGNCGSHDYSKAESSHPNEPASQALATAREDVLTLQQRALRAGGSIDLPRFNGTTEIKATEDSLTLSFERVPYDHVYDQVNFPVKGQSAKITEGAIMCFDDNSQLTVNGTFTTLQQYVHETAILDR